MASQCRQNYHQESEMAINKQINIELYASYVYQSMAYYFDRDDVALDGLTNLFKKSSDEERQHAQKLMKFQNKRGGRVVLQAIQKPSQNEWGTGLDAMRSALELGKSVNQSLIDLHNVGVKHCDEHLAHFVKDTFMDAQVDLLKEISDHITNLKRVGPGLGEYTYVKKSLG